MDFGSFPVGQLARLYATPEQKVTAAESKFLQKNVPQMTAPPGFRRKPWRHLADQVKRPIPVSPRTANQKVKSQSNECAAEGVCRE